jgi:outer membrane protein TolC
MRRFLVVSLAVLGCATLPAHADSLSFAQALQRVVERDPTLRISQMQAQRARHDVTRAESELGWRLDAQGGSARDVSQSGTPLDRTDANASIGRQLGSGGTIGLGGDLLREDHEFPLAGQPNPFQSTGVDLSYRLPLAQGAGGVGYKQGLLGAEAAADAANADFDASRDALARRVADLYFNAALTRARIVAADEAIARAERFKSYIARNAGLGLAERKDRLQAEAQFLARSADHRTLVIAWENQRTALNRLMEQPWNDEWRPALGEPPLLPPGDQPLFETEALARSAELRREQARLRVAETTLERARDQGRDRTDLVFSVGNRKFSGDLPAPAGSVSESQNVGGVRFEYSAALDNRGADAGVSQAYLDRSIAQQRIAAIESELRYTVKSLAAEIHTASEALQQARARQEVEREKLDEATRRHRQGRADTAQVIQFENDYEAAILAAEQQAIDLARRRVELELLRGTLWSAIDLGAAPDVTQGDKP